MKSMTIKKNRLITISVAMLLIAIGLLNMYSGNVVFSAILTLLVSAYNFYSVRKNIARLIMFGFILFSNYSICFPLYISPIDSLYASFSNTEPGCISIFVLLAFNSLLLLFGACELRNEDFSEKIISDENNNPIIGVGAIFLVILIFVFGFGRPDTAGERGTVSAYYEYAIIIIMIGLIYSAKNKVLRNTLLIIAIAYCVQDLVYGGRITSLQMLIMLFLVFFHDKKINLIKIAPMVIVGLAVFTAVGEMRGSFNFSFTAIVKAFTSLFSGGFALDTAYAAYYASEVFVVAALRDSSALKLSMLFSFLVSLVTGGGGIDSNLSVYTKEIMWHGGGGVTPFYMYYYLGFIGVIVIALYISFLLQKTYWNKSLYSKALIVYITYSVPRWYLYSNSAIIRGILMFSIVFIVCRIFDRITRRKSELLCFIDVK